MELDLLCWYNIWPDSIEDGKSLLEEAFRTIDYYGNTDERKQADKVIVQNSFNEKYKEKE